MLKKPAPSGLFLWPQRVAGVSYDLDPGLLGNSTDAGLVGSKNRARPQVTIASSQPIKMSFSAVGQARLASPWRWLAALAMLAITVCSRAEQPQTELPRIALGAGMHRIEAQVASTPAQRQIGLMWRKQMPQHEGMLFIFEQASVQCFWMMNTLIPLTAAFVADDGTIVNLADMQPQTTQSHCSNRPVRYVLEMNQGWFAKRGLGPGARLTGISQRP